MMCFVTLQPLSFPSQDEGTDFQYDEAFAPTNVMDRWILSFTQSLILFVKEEMKSEILSWNFIKLSIFLFPIVYRLYTVVPHLVRFIDQLKTGMSGLTGNVSRLTFLVLHNILFN